MRLIIEGRLEGAQTGATAAEARIVDVEERQDRIVAAVYARKAIRKH
jgi:hypothetical protein